MDKEEILSHDEKAKHFFDEIQKLKQDLDTLKSRDIIDAAAIVQAGITERVEAQAEEKRLTEDAQRQAQEAQKQAQEAQRQAQEAAQAQDRSPAQISHEEIQAAASAAEPAPAESAADTQTQTEATADQTAASAADQTAAAASAASAVVQTAAAASAAAGGADNPATVSKGSAEVFADQFRQQMETQMQVVQEEANTKARQKAAKAAKKEAYRQEKAARNRERREERRARAKRKQLERKIRAEVKKKKRIADKSAEMGGGIVNLHDTTVSTEIQPVAQYSLRDLLGIVPRQKKRAAISDEELQALIDEQERITAEARATASQLSKVRASRYHNSAFGRRMDAFKKACDKHKTLLLSGMSLVLLVCVGLAGVFNYCTAYEYSYNGHVLGYVKSKDEVLRITDMVQRALTEDKEMEVIIDERDDISFKRVSTLDKEVIPDTSEEVLRRLTYMGDVNVMAYGIYVNGKRTGAVKSKDVAADVLKKIEERYASDKEGSVIEKAEILETIEVRKSNINLRNVYSADRMAELLCTSGQKETVHTVIAGETLSDIAETYGTTEERLQRDNEGVDPTQLEVGSTLLIRQNAPLLTVRMTEKRSYTQTIEYETKEKKTDEMYQGDEEIQQEGEDGSEDITERTVSINGEQESLKVLKHVITKKPVPKIVLVGTAERPPTVGDGKYIWPLAGGYTLTSNFGYRWGRLHAGIDLGTPVGNDVLAADGGTVIRAGYFGGYGYCVDIDHQNGQMTRYGHLSSILVSVGDEVYEGQHIAESGNTGFSTGAHLHFEIHTNGQAHDPLQDLP